MHYMYTSTYMYHAGILSLRLTTVSLGPRLSSMGLTGVSECMTVHHVHGTCLHATCKYSTVICIPLLAKHLLSVHAACLLARTVDSNHHTMHVGIVNHVITLHIP